MSSPAALQRTPLWATHKNLGARLVEFGGWEMPVQYTSITDEHLAVRNAAGIFDISHMGEVTVSGANAVDFLNHILTNDLLKVTPGLGQYNILCNERGGAIDDLYAYKLSDGVYLLVINASRIETDVAWLQAQAAAFGGDVQLTDASHNYSAVAVQGPRVKDFINAVIPGPSLSAKRVNAVTDLKKNEIGGFQFEYGSVLVSRTGYTGEDGFEIVGGDDSIRHAWGRFLEIGAASGIKPCGLGARDTLRTEVCFPLYGHELDEQTTPIEAALGRFVSFEKGDFIGALALAAQNAGGAPKRLIAFKMVGATAPPRPGYAIYCGNKKIGVVTSGTPSPSLGIGIGMGYVAPEFALAGRNIEIEIRDRSTLATVVPKPIYRKA